MKAKILVLGLLAATVATVLVYPTLRSNATGAQLRPSQPTVVRPIGTAKVEVVFVLDTTGSMGGLIDAAKEKVWSIASTLAQADPAPQISIGLVAYRDRGDAYVTKTVDLSTDLDSMYGTLMDFTADGGGDGPEDVNQALYDAVNGMSWSTDQSAYKVVFLIGDAPPHMDYQDGPKYSEIVAAAAAKGIVVNTIQCGGQTETIGPWQQIAALGHGRYFTVEQAGGALAIATPYDQQIATLAAQLDETRLYYGSDAERAAMAGKVEATERLHASASPAAQARRGAFNASASGAANMFGKSELIQDVASGAVDLAAVPPAQMPPAMASLSFAERSAYIETAAKLRDRLQRQIAALAGERDEFIADKVEELGGAADSLDRQIYDAVREQAAPKGLAYQGGPKF